MALLLRVPLAQGLAYKRSCVQTKEHARVNACERLRKTALGTSEKAVENTAVGSGAGTSERLANTAVGTGERLKKPL